MRSLAPMMAEPFLDTAKDGIALESVRPAVASAALLMNSLLEVIMLSFYQFLNYQIDKSYYPKQGINTDGYHRHIAYLGEDLSPRLVIGDDGANVGAERYQKTPQDHQEFSAYCAGRYNYIFHTLEFHIRNLVIIRKQDCALFFHSLVAQKT